MLYYIASKLLPLIFEPIGLSIILIISFIKSRRNSVIYAVLFILWTSSTNVFSQFLLNIVESPWRQIKLENVNSANAIVVLSGGLQPFNSKIIIQEWQDPDRFFAGINLLKSDKAPYIIFTAGIRPLQKDIYPESKIYSYKAIELGIPKEKILITKFAKNTAEEGARVKELLKNDNQNEKQKIILVTSAFHMNRAKKIFERNNFVVIPFPVDFKNYQYKGNDFKTFLFRIVPNAYDLQQTSFVIREIMGRIVYRSF
tara:strand:- start:8892 stop:9659 length:768 start_codon:yes stop_codon:yes gene_type:complete